MSQRNSFRPFEMRRLPDGPADGVGPGFTAAAPVAALAAPGRGFAIQFMFRVTRLLRWRLPVGDPQTPARLLPLKTRARASRVSSPLCPASVRRHLSRCEA